MSRNPKRWHDGAAPHGPRQHPFAAQRGFTLVELLAVITIILILLALLLPVVSRGIFNAKSMQCLSNEKQLQMAHQLYLNDNSQQLIPYYGSTLWMNYILPYHESGGIDAKHDRVRFCPNATKCTISDFTTAATTAWYYSNDGSYGSYGINGYLYGTIWAQDMPGNDWLIGGRWHPRYTMGDVQVKWFKHMGNTDPSSTPLFLDCQWVDLWPREDQIDGAVNQSVYDSASVYGTDPKSCGSLARSSLTRHGDAVNIVYVDGHGKRVRDADLKYQKWNRTWSVNAP